MFALIPYLLPENQAYVRDYLYEIWQKVATVTSSIVAPPLPEDVQEIFLDYAQSEEAKIKQNLTDIKYTIDAVGTVYLVTGPGRIEKVSRQSYVDIEPSLRYVTQNFFPVVKLLLERHWQIFHVAKTRALKRMELEDASRSISFVYNALDLRLAHLRGERIRISCFGREVKTLVAICLNHSQDLTSLLKRFAHGMVSS
jgi:hypothetical protein